MVKIGNTVVSFELFEQYFCCDLAVCKGCCCVEGDAGAPLTKDEVKQLNDILPLIRPFLTEKAKEVIDNQGVSYIDKDGDYVTSIINGKECVFAGFENEICFCVLEKAYNQGIISFPKPISCHLYPVRLENFENFTAVNFHRWNLCNSAEKYGKTKKIRAYKFLKNPLIRQFGQDWYAELEQVAETYFAEFKKLY